VRSYNFNGGNGFHLANQNQNVCVRRERGNCKICWIAKDVKDVDTNGDNAMMMGGAGGDSAKKCCGYGKDGLTGVSGYDCLQIPGAAKGTKCSAFTGANVINADRFCGNEAGLGTKTTATGGATPMNVGTICTKQDPFSLQFLTDAFEADVESAADAANSQAGSGFQLTYTMSSNNC